MTPDWLPAFYVDNGDGVFIMDAPNGCKYPFRYSDTPHDVVASKTVDKCMSCPNCGRCHISHSGSHDFTGMMRLPDGRVVVDHLHVAVQGSTPGRKRK